MVRMGSWVEARAHEALAVMDERGESTIAEIAQARGVSRSTVSCWVALLYRRGVIQRTRDAVPSMGQLALWSRRGAVPVRGDCVIIYDPSDRRGVEYAVPRQQCYHCQYRHVVEDIETCRYRTDAIECCDLELAARGPMTLEDVGERLGVTRERIRQIERTALLKLRMACARKPQVFTDLMAAIVDRENDAAAMGDSSVFNGEPCTPSKPVVGVDEKSSNRARKLLSQKKVIAALRAVDNSENGLSAEEIGTAVGMSTSWAYTMVVRPFLEVSSRKKGVKGWTTRRWKRGV